MANFHEQRAITPEGMIWTILKLEEDIMVLNNVTKFHKAIFETIQLREGTLLGVTYERTYVPTGVPTDRGNT